MAYDSIRAMMDQMMGSDRDATAEEKQRNKRSFDDPEIDTHFLCGLSPYQVLTGVKGTNDMIPPKSTWDKIQDVTLQIEWGQLPQEEKDKYGFEYELKEVCARLVAQMDQRIVENKRKIAGETVLSPEHQVEVDRMDTQIRDLQSRCPVGPGWV